MTQPRVTLPRRQRVEAIWGMVVSIDIRSDRAGAEVDSAFDEVFAWFAHVDAIFSPYRPDSEVSRLAAGTLSLDDVDPDLVMVLARCEELRQTTAGYFDARRPDGTVDPTGLVKGWAVERASAMLAARGAGDHVINAGGDIRTRGAPGPDRSWHVGIAHPLQRDALTTVVTATDTAIATSGTAERGAHVYDPHTGRAALDLASVTLIGTGGHADLGTLDAWATAALAMAFEAPSWLATLDGIDAYVVDADGMAWATDGFDRHRVA